MSDGENLERIGRAMMLAWTRIKKAQARMWGDWMTIGEGLLEGRRWAMQQAGTNKPEGKGYVIAYAEWLKRFKVDDMDKSDRAKLLQLMEERPAVEEWRATLTDYDRRNLNNPTIAWRKWTAATRVKKPKPRSAGVSASEHGRAQATVEHLQARVTELEEELAAALERIQELESALEAAGVQLEGAEPGATDEAEEEAEAAQPAKPKLAWTGDERQGFLARGLVGGTPVAYTVTPVNIGGRVHFEMKIVTDYRIFDFAQPVKELADRYGFSLTHDVKGKRRRFDPVPHSAEARAQCEADYAQQ